MGNPLKKKLNRKAIRENVWKYVYPCKHDAMTSDETRDCFNKKLAIINIIYISVIWLWILIFALIVWWQK